MIQGLKGNFTEKRKDATLNGTSVRPHKALPQEAPFLIRYDYVDQG